MTPINQGKTNIKYLLIIIILAAVAGGLVIWQSYQSEKISIPIINIPSDETAGWKMYINEQSGFEFKYPENFGANVWRPLTWPATSTVVSIGQDPLQRGCPNLHTITGASPVQEKGTTTNNISYSLYKGSDIGAGQLYSEYCYVIEKDPNYYVLDFVIWSHSGCGDGNCGAYCGTQYEQECRNLNRSRDIEQPIQKIVFTLRFI